MFIGLLLLWILWNGRFTIEILVIGILLSGAITAFAIRFMDYNWRTPLRLLRKFGLIVQYIGVLFSEIVKANICVIGVIVKEKQDYHPVLIHFNPGLQSRLAQVVLANSITLTPGTITVKLENGNYTVHCLDKSMGDGIEQSKFVELLTKMERKEAAVWK